MPDRSCVWPRASLPAMPTLALRKPRRFKFSSYLRRALWQRKSIDGVVSGWHSQLRHFFRQLGHLQVVAGHHTDILLAFGRVGDGAHRNVPAHDGLPKLFSIARVKRPEPAAHVTVENQAARGGQHRTITRSTA